MLSLSKRHGDLLWASRHPALNMRESVCTKIEFSDDVTVLRVAPEIGMPADSTVETWQDFCKEMGEQVARCFPRGGVSARIVTHGTLLAIEAVQALFAQVVSPPALLFQRRGKLGAKAFYYVRPAPSSVPGAAPTHVFLDGRRIESTEWHLLPTGAQLRYTPMTARANKWIQALSGGWDVEVSGMPPGFALDALDLAVEYQFTIPTGTAATTLTAAELFRMTANDPRGIPLKNLRESLLEAGVDQDEIDGMGRWDMVRTLGTTITQKVGEEHVKQVETALFDAENEAKNQGPATTFKSVIEEELECSICCDLMMHASSLACSHSFCRVCIMQARAAAEAEKTCPLCRAPAPSEPQAVPLVDRIIERYVASHASSADREMRKKRELQSDAMKAAADVAPVKRRRMPNLI